MFCTMTLLMFFRVISLFFSDLLTELDDYCTQEILAPRLLVIQMAILLTERFVVLFTCGVCYL